MPLRVLGKSALCDVTKGSDQTHIREELTPPLELPCFSTYYKVPQAIGYFGLGCKHGAKTLFTGGFFGGGWFIV